MSKVIYLRTGTKSPSELGHRIWCCPRCHGNLKAEGENTSACESWLACMSCGSTYELFDGIPDLRLPGESWIDYDEDKRQARQFIEETRGLTLQQQLAWVFAARKSLTQKEIVVRVDQVINSVGHLEEQVDDWLSLCLSKPQAPNLMRGGSLLQELSERSTERQLGPELDESSSFDRRFHKIELSVGDSLEETLSLDLGCGPGQLIAAAARRGHTVVGIDVRLLWLLAAKRLIEQYGGVPILAAALAEHMPLRDGSIHSVISLDVIEHVADVPKYLEEINRVTADSGFVALSTPNRYSLAAEPHVGVWGVGWVPRRWQKQFVHWRKKIDYPCTRLLSVREIAMLIKQHTQFRPHMIVAKVAPHEIARFPAYRQHLARLYNVLAGIGLFKLPLLAVGPFFRVVGRKES